LNGVAKYQLVNIGKLARALKVDVGQTIQGCALIPRLTADHSVFRTAFFCQRNRCARGQVFGGIFWLARCQGTRLLNPKNGEEHETLTRCDSAVVVWPSRRINVTTSKRFMFFSIFWINRRVPWHRAQPENAPKPDPRTLFLWQKKGSPDTE